MSIAVITIARPASYVELRRQQPICLDWTGGSVVILHSATAFFSILGPKIIVGFV